MLQTFYLLDRVKDAFKLNLDDVNSVVNSDRLCTLFGELLTNLSYRLTKNIDKWKDDVSMIPDLSEKDIYNYFVYKLDTKRQLKSKAVYNISSTPLC